LGYRSNRKSLEISKLQLAKYEYNYQRKRNDLTAEINALQKSLKNSESILRSYENLIVASVQNKHQTFKNYQESLSSIDELLDAHSDELSVQLDSIEANIKYQKELLELKNLLDVLLISKIQSP
jgi:outer membrane protein TolC